MGKLSFAEVLIKAQAADQVKTYNFPSRKNQPNIFCEWKNHMIICIYIYAFIYSEVILSVSDYKDLMHSKAFNTHTRRLPKQKKQKRRGKTNNKGKKEKKEKKKGCWGGLMACWDPLPRAFRLKRLKDGHLLSVPCKDGRLQQISTSLCLDWFLQISVLG